MNDRAMNDHADAPGPMPESDPAIWADAERVLAEQVASGGRRLGLIVLAGDVAWAERAAASLTAVGLAPLRRLAQLRPRPDETTFRVADIADFIDRVGHEYAAAFLPTSSVGGAIEPIVDAASREGCAVHWH